MTFSSSALAGVLTFLSPLDLSHLAILLSDRDLENALESWEWIGIRGLRPRLVTAFGDVFFDGPNGIAFLSTLEGTLTVACSDLEGLPQLLATEDGRDHWLLEGFVIGARSRGQILAPGDCYDFKVAPVLGGAMSGDSVHTMSFVTKVNIAGQLHQQVKALPPGTKINKVTISD
jgi:hypothetical protein